VNNYLKTVISIDDEEYTEQCVQVDGLAWTDFLEVFLRQSLPGAGYRIDPERIDEIVDFVEIQSEERVKAFFNK
jgi:hypothetical protein